MTPVLDRLVQQGTIWWDEHAHQYMGRASDGVVVALGHNPDSTEKYLATCPTPEDW